jgi:putative IMPACT (imprinted ancient) family translation regulator
MRKLDHILCIVVRYFGGVKLGAGGLVRAYSSSCSKALLENEIIELFEGYKIRVSSSYENSQKINYILSNSKIIYKEFSDIVIFEALVNKETLELLKPFNPEILDTVLLNS